jgi:hypothetical protein
MPPSPSLSPSWSTRRRRHPRRSAGSSPPRLDLPLRAFAAVQQHMERVQALVASCANLAQLRLEFGRRHRPSARPLRRRAHAEYRVLGECGKRDKRDGGGAEQERLTFLQTQQTRHLIDLGARQQCRFGRTSARPIARMLGLRLANLPGKIGGDVDSPSAVTARRACVRGRTRGSPPMPNGMLGRDKSLRKTSPPPNLTRGRIIAPFRIDANGPDQNSAGKYPLISRPIQISTRVGVVQAIRRFP